MTLTSTYRFGKTRLLGVLARLGRESPAALNTSKLRRWRRLSLQTIHLTSAANIKGASMSLRDKRRGSETPKEKRGEAHSQGEPNPKPEPSQRGAVSEISQAQGREARRRRTTLSTNRTSSKLASYSVGDTMWQFLVTKAGGDDWIWPTVYSLLQCGNYLTRKL